VRFIGASPSQSIRYVVYPITEICLLREAERIGLRSIFCEAFPLGLASEPELAHEPNYGRKRRVLLKSEEKDNAARRDDHEQVWEDLGAESGQDNELLAWGCHIVSGATGNPRGRHAEGEQDPERIAHYIEHLAPGFNFNDATRDERAELVATLVSPPYSENVQAVADVFGINRRFVYRLRDRGEALLSQKGTTRGRADSSA
jgi:hypothetical protein